MVLNRERWVKIILVLFLFLDFAYVSWSHHLYTCNFTFSLLLELTLVYEEKCKEKVKMQATLFLSSSSYKFHMSLFKEYSVQISDCGF